MRLFLAWLILASVGLSSPAPQRTSTDSSAPQIVPPSSHSLEEQEKKGDEEKAKKKTKIFVIVNKSNPIDALTKEQVRHLFLRKEITWERVLTKAKKKSKSFSKSEKVRPIEFTRKKENELFLKHVLEKDKDSLERHWIKLQYQSAIRRPKRVGTPERVLKYTSALKGCVGFINADALTEAHKKRVKVVLTLEI